MNHFLFLRCPIFYFFPTATKYLILFHNAVWDYVTADTSNWSKCYSCPFYASFMTPFTPYCDPIITLSSPYCHPIVTLSWPYASSLNWFTRWLNNPDFCLLQTGNIIKLSVSSLKTNAAQVRYLRHRPSFNCFYYKYLILSGSSFLT